MIDRIFSQIQVITHILAAPGLWARQWVIKNMGHKHVGPNKRAMDFNIAAHDHFGYGYDPVKDDELFLQVQKNLMENN